MTAQQGAKVLIKVGNGGSPESFATIGGLRISSLTLNNHMLDATNLESGVWRQLSGGVLRAIQVRGSGMFTNAVAEETIRGYAFSGSVNNYRFIFANGNYVAGPFVVSFYHREGDVEEEETYDITLESAGTVSFAAS